MASLLTDLFSQPRNPGFVPGHSPAIRKLNAVVEDIACTNIPVLLMGESGTGKDVYGRVIHLLSRQRAPLKKLNCRAAEHREMLEVLKSSLRVSEGDSQDGRGTLFLDGIDELDLEGQTSLLHLFPDGETDDGNPNVFRIISSTLRNLEQEVESGRFRAELYFRINGVCLRLPPLRARKEDIFPFMEHFLAKQAEELGREAPLLSDAEKEFVGTHDWPGNVRELENFARRIVLLGDSRRAMDDLRELPTLKRADAEEPQEVPLKVAARTASRLAERDLIAKALERTHWNRKRAARELQISYKSLLYKIKQTGLEGKQGERKGRSGNEKHDANDSGGLLDRGRRAGTKPEPHHPSQERRKQELEKPGDSSCRTDHHRGPCIQNWSPGRVEDRRMERGSANSNGSRTAGREDYPTPVE
jgi:two-component system, NtrC family, response regulator AtoC